MKNLSRYIQRRVTPLFFMRAVFWGLCLATGMELSSGDLVGAGDTAILAVFFIVGAAVGRADRDEEARQAA